VLLIYAGWVYNDHPMITFAPTIAKKLLRHVPFVTQFTWPLGALPHQMPRLAQKLRKKLVQWAGTKDVDYYYGTLLRDSDRITVFCEQHGAALAERLPSLNGKSVLIPHPLVMHVSPDPDGSYRKRGREKLDVKSDDFLLVYYGYVYPGKGVETLFQSLQLVSQKRDNVRLIIVGGMMEKSDAQRNYAREIRALPQRLGIEDKVTWVGELPPDTDEASVYLHASDASVLPFDIGVRCNNTSFVGIVAHGLPTITTQGDVLEKPFVHEENVLLCPPKDPQATAAAIQRLMDDPDLRQRLRRGALTMTHEWFSWEKAAERTLALLDVKR
jgi:glycosyltransferase involved in cell wall biosynthesis